MKTELASATSSLLGASMLVAAALAWVLMPRVSAVEPILKLNELVPTKVGEWKQVKTSAAPVNPNDERDTDRPYDDVLMREYADSHGHVIFLALAYGRKQRQEVKIHRPELCYVAQGFQVLQRARTTFPIQSSRGAVINGTRMLVQAPGRVEAISYWVRIGDLYSNSGWSSRWYILKEGLKGRVLDGILVRVSQIVENAGSASDVRYRLQERFIADLIQAMPPNGRQILVDGRAT